VAASCAVRDDQSDQSDCRRNAIKRNDSPQRRASHIPNITGNLFRLPDVEVKRGQHGTQCAIDGIVGLGDIGCRMLVLDLVLSVQYLTHQNNCPRPRRRVWLPRSFARQEAVEEEHMPRRRVEVREVPAVRRHSLMIASGLARTCRRAAGSIG
jgi:hypothetical protein